MEQSLKGSVDGVSFCRPNLQNQVKGFVKRVWRSLEWYGRIKAARALARHGHPNYGKKLLEELWQ